MLETGDYDNGTAMSTSLNSSYIHYSAGMRFGQTTVDFVGDLFFYELQQTTHGLTQYYFKFPNQVCEKNLLRQPTIPQGCSYEILHLVRH